MATIMSRWLATDLSGQDGREVVILRVSRDGERYLVKDEAGDQGWIWEDQLAERLE